MICLIKTVLVKIMMIMMSRLMMVTHCMLRTIVESVMIKDEYDDFCEDDVNNAYNNHPYRPHHLHHNHH